MECAIRCSLWSLRACHGQRAVFTTPNQGLAEKRVWPGVLRSERRTRHERMHAAVSEPAADAEMAHPTCRYQTNSVACHIQKLAVHPSSRNQGIAGTLLLVRSEADTRVLIVSSHRLRHGIEVLCQCFRVFERHIVLLVISCRAAVQKQALTPSSHRPD